ncbi:MAG: SprT family zinc-dependent metalloprotease [Candidatus Uhrbacteria bacterium]
MFPTKIIRSNRRTISLEITSEAVLVVRVPQRVSEAFIEKIVRDKTAWVEKKISEMKKRPQSRVKEFIDGEQFFYLGESYGLKITKAKKIELKNDLIFPEKFLSKAKTKMTAWYKQEAQEILTDRAKIWAEQMGVKFTAVKINSAEKRWGSCSHKNQLNFGWKLILQPLEVVDYVVIHELAHVPHKNHSKDFWNFVVRFCPNFKALRKQLKNNQYAQS